MKLRNENEAYAELLGDHLLVLVRRLRLIPADRWDWQPEPTAPSPRILAEHTWQWLVCDRQHIREPDASLHPRVPDPPTDQSQMCDVLAAERENWLTLILSLTTEELDEPRSQFNDIEPVLNIRSFICHMIQNAIYKHGQLSTLFFTLGLDGPEPYSAPLPNPIYEEVFGPAIA
jgi:hypothetical protein